MLLQGKRASDGHTQGILPAELCMRKENLPAGIQFLQQGFVKQVQCFGAAGTLRVKPETYQAQRYRGQHFETGMVLYLLPEPLCKPDMFPYFFLQLFYPKERITNHSFSALKRRPSCMPQSR